MGLKDRLRPGGGSSHRAEATIDEDEFKADASDIEWQNSLTVARDHVAGADRGAAVISSEEFLEDAADPDWQATLATAREHVETLERSGRSR